MTINNYFTRDELLRPAPRRFREFDVQCNGSNKRVRIRSLVESERAQWELAPLDRRGLWKEDKASIAKCTLIALCVVDHDGNPIFTTDDVKALLKQDAAVTGTIYNECLEHVGIRYDDAERLEKNSDVAGTTETPGD